MARARSPFEVLALHQFPAGDSGGCTGPDCAWGLAADGGPDDGQMAQHQLEVLAEAGFVVQREQAGAMQRGTMDYEWCRRCGGPNVIWSAASPLWNLVMRGNDMGGESRFRDLVCIPCFIVCAVEAGLPEGGWRLTLATEPEGLIYETPDGRVWDPERFLWVDPT